MPTSSASRPEAEAAAAADRLCPVPVRSVLPAGGGGNSRLYRVVGADGSAFALKSYPPRDKDTRDRLGQEFAALSFVGRHDHERRTPAPVARDGNGRFGLLEWIDGVPVREPKPADIDAMLAFAGWLAQARNVPEAAGLPAASESCLSLTEIAVQIHRRHCRLADVAGEEPELAAWLAGRFAPVLDRALVRAETAYRGAGLDPAANIVPAQRTLSPSDFGLHNALRRPDGKLAFLDFEYFGWDDPVRLACDVAWHPGMGLAEEAVSRFTAGCHALFAADPGFAVRRAAQGPLVGLRWCMIILNEFLPERWLGRVHAGHGGDRRTVLSRQLCKAQSFLERVERSMQDSSFASSGGPSGAVPPASPAPAAAALDRRSLHLRSLIVDALENGGRGHPGPALSLVEILRVLYDDVLRVDPTRPQWPERDRFVLSKGHGCLALYAILADKGFFAKEELLRQCKAGAMLGGHPERDRTPGVEASTGALGHGLSIGIGMALAARLGRRDSRVFVAMGDGETNEGSVWEAAMTAAKHRLDTLVAIVDHNKLQSYGPTADVLDMAPMAEKWRAFGWAVREVDGHDVAALRTVFASVPFEPGRPSAVIAHTVKGRGFPFAEQNPKWHHKSKLKPEEVTAMRRAVGQEIV